MDDHLAHATNNFASLLSIDLDIILELSISLDACDPLPRILE
jgi:hypothetical protein